MAVVLLIWLFSGDRQSARDQAPAPQTASSQTLHQVEARWSVAQALPREQIAQGQLLPWQQVRIRAQVAGRVEQLLKQQGDPVVAGQGLLRLSDDGRSAQLAQAQAQLTLRRNELNSARALQASQFVTETELTRLESELARARAELTAAELAVQYLQPAAPFTGRVDRRHVEVGEWVQPGADLVTLVDVSRLRVTAQIPQQEVAAIEVGQSVTLKLLDGRAMRGTVAFVSLAADPSTRSFYVEVHADNPELWRVAGASATLQVHLPDVMAHRVSPALLSLDETGRLGIHTLSDGLVEFQPVRVLGIDSDGATLVGLPERVQLITQGAGFVSPGQRVEVNLKTAETDFLPPSVSARGSNE